MPILINIVLPGFVTGSFATYQDRKTEIIFKDRKVSSYKYEWQEVGRISITMPFGEYSLILGSNEYYEAEFAHFLDIFEFLE